MYNNNIDERNAARRRHSAMVLAIFLHLALAAALYFSGSGNTLLDEILSPNNSEDTSPTPQPQAVKLP